MIHPALSAPELFTRLQSEPGRFFLDSAMEGSPFGRYSFVGARPFLILRSKEEAVDIRQGDRVEFFGEILERHLEKKEQTVKWIEANQLYNETLKFSFDY